MKIIDRWWACQEIPIVKIDGEFYALSSWNGEAWTMCWKCLDRWTADPKDESFTIWPDGNIRKD